MIRILMAICSYPRDRCEEPKWRTTGEWCVRWAPSVLLRPPGTGARRRSSRSLHSLPPVVPFGHLPPAARWERRWCERHGKEMGTRRKRPTFPRSHLVPSSYSRVSMWRELEEINRVTWDPRNERRERRRDECGAVGLFPFPSHSHPSLPRVTHSAAPHSLHSSVREMNGVRRTVTTIRTEWETEGKNRHETSEGGE